MFFKIGVLKNFAIFTGKHLCQSLFLTKLQAYLQAFRPVTLLEKTPTQVFFCKYCKSFKSTLFNKTSAVGASVYCTFKTLTRLAQQNESSLFAVLIADVGKKILKLRKITESCEKLHQNILFISYIWSSTLLYTFILTISQ